MKGGSYELFCSSLARGMELEFKYKGITYFVQGYHGHGTPHELYLEQTDPLNPDRYLAVSDLIDYRGCAEKLRKIKFFDGQCLDEIEQDVIWTEG